MSNYNEHSIKSLDYFDHIRKYPGMYIGSKDENGLLHCVKEILSNSIDEWLNGAGTSIEITILQNGGIRIEDNGRGIPHGKHENGMSLLSACFGVANTGGKFNNKTGQSGYNSSGGEHGTGGKAVNALSTELIVTTSREGIKETSIFSKGILLEEKSEIIDKEKHGTTVQFIPDKEIFETVKFDIEKIKNMIQEFSFLCKGLSFILKDEITSFQTTYLSENGLYDYIDFLNKDKNMLSEPFYFEKEEGTFRVEAAFVYNTGYTSSIKLYTNNIPQLKGSHLTGFKTALTSTMNTIAKEKKWLKENENNLSGSDLEEGLLAIINFKMIDPVFKGQNKEELSSSEGRTYCQRFTTLALKDFLLNREKDLKNIFEKAKQSRKAREAAKKAREAVRKPKEKGLKAKMALSDKFIDCSSKDASKRNLLLVEGKSASTSAIEARNPATDCIYMLRGKTISPLKTTIDKILANQEMSDIIRVIGAGFGNENFDINKMNFDKIVITADQDADGFSIELLLITFFYTYMRPLVESGKLYRAVTPLYIIRQRDKEYYCYTEKELEDWKLAHSGTYELLRAKG